MELKKLVSIVLVALLCAGVLSACGNSNQKTSTVAKQSASSQNTPSSKPVAPESHPVGDIPDSQAFITYTSSSGGYSIQVPEGWARKVKGGNTVTFISKLDGVKISTKAAASNNLTVDHIKNNWISKLKKNGMAIKIKSVSKVNVPAGSAIEVVYSSNSKPNSVTGKQVRLENNTYIYSKNGKQAVLTLWAPYGSDNVDQWKKMSRSFGWH